MPYSSLLMSALACGIDLPSARRMGYTVVRMLVDARNDASGQADGGRRDGTRDATQADIAAFMR